MPCFNRRLRQLREEAGLSQQELSNQTGISKSIINMYERGEREPGLETLEIFADFFNVDMNYLVGYQAKKHIPQIEGVILTTHEKKVITAYRDKPPIQPAVDNLLDVAPDDPFAQYYGEPSNVVPLPFPVKYGRSIPVLGRVPAGIPIEAVTDIVDYVPLEERFSNDGRDYFALCVKGDSMYPDYMKGDYIIIRQQPTAESGDDVVAYVGEDDATLKRLHRDFNGIELRPINPAYPVLKFSNEEVMEKPVTIAGTVVGFSRMRAPESRQMLADSGPSQEALDKFFNTNNDENENE